VVTLDHGDPVAVALVEAIHTGDLDALERLLGQQPGLAAARIGDDKGGADAAAHRHRLARPLPQTDRRSSPR
jgi:hypothetical protein